MVFSEFPFLFYFLPVFFAVYFAVPKQARNAVLLIASLLFYFYGEKGYVLLLVFSSVTDYAVSLIIEKNRGRGSAKAALLFSIFANLTILGFFKYSGFIVENINAVLNTAFTVPHIHLPLGISFYTFQTMSYTIDVYRGNAKPQKSPLDFAAYVTMFPQLVAGPIVRYQDVSAQINNRRHSWEDFSSGATRFVVGLGKKVIIADSLGSLNAVAHAAESQSVLFYWLMIVSFMFQIYFDFSGYSDMAIGLGRIIGFRFLENFDYPFIAKSASEFWRRWHISMGTWFREYIYIPLGGSRVSKVKQIRNIAVVWLVTGIWHGAAWNYILFGLFFGVVLIAEKFFLLRFLKKFPAFVQHVYLMSLVIFSFVIFHIESVSGIGDFFGGLVGFADGGRLPLLNAESVYYLRSFAVIFVIAAVGATPLPRYIVRKAGQGRISRKVINFATPVFVVGLLLIVTGYIVDNSFSPFLYFRF